MLDSVRLGVPLGPAVRAGGCTASRRRGGVGVVMVAMPGCSGLVGTAAGADAEWMLDSVRLGVPLGPAVRAGGCTASRRRGGVGLQVPPATRSGVDNATVPPPAFPLSRQQPAVPTIASLITNPSRTRHEIDTRRWPELQVPPATRSGVDNATVPPPAFPLSRQQPAVPTIGDGGSAGAGGIKRAGGPAATAATAGTAQPVPQVTAAMGPRSAPGPAPALDGGQGGDGGSAGAGGIKRAGGPAATAATAGTAQPVPQVPAVQAESPLSLATVVTAGNAGLLYGTGGAGGAGGFGGFGGDGGDGGIGGLVGSGGAGGAGGVATVAGHGGHGR